MHLLKNLTHFALVRYTSNAKSGLKCLASGIIVAHNHPSGNLKPSEADITLTKKIKEGGKILEIQLLDHLILSNEGYFSFADEGLL